MFPVEPAPAIPQFARQTGLSCTHCHSIPPKLNLGGEAFLARGFRSRTRAAGEAPPLDLQQRLLVSTWVTARHEQELSGSKQGKTYLPKLEFVTGGPIGDSLSYFVEWRVLSYQMQSDRSLQDRSGRFEDIFLDWEFLPNHEIRVGQFRALEQYDVSLRLSISEPALFSTSLPGAPSLNPRTRAVRAFSPAGRSPGLSYAFHSIEGERPSDGLFHFITLPFPGELSFPLTRGARSEASFELEGIPKGVFLETFYRRNLNSVGISSFIGDGRWLLMGLGMLNYGDLYATAGVRLDGGSNLPSNQFLSSLELEYLPTWNNLIRPGVGFRVEHVTGRDIGPAFIPYLVLSGPNTSFTFLTQLQFRIQENSSAMVLDFSILF